MESAERSRLLKISFFVWDSLTLTEEKCNLSIVYWGALLVLLPECGSVLWECVCVVKTLLCFCSSGSGPLPAVTETLTAAEDLQTASQVTGPVGDPHTAKLFIISLSPSH